MIPCTRGGHSTNTPQQILFLSHCFQKSSAAEMSEVYMNQVVYSDSVCELLGVYKLPLQQLLFALQILKIPVLELTATVLGK